MRRVIQKEDPLKRNILGFVLAALVVLIVGCVHQPLGVKHKEVLIYDQAFDYTYDGVIKALNSAYPWQLSTTDKSRGTIEAFNQKYWDTLDADKRTATILVKRISRKQTSVELALESQTVVGVGDLLKAIDSVLGRSHE